MRRILRKICLMSAIIALLLSLGTGRAETVWGDLNARYKDVPSIEYQGETWRLKSRLNVILLMGIDKRELEETPEYEYRSGGQADFQVLLVFDDSAKTITPIQINRDAMTRITVLNLMGKVSGTRMAQICLAHGFGDGREQSCQLAVSALSGYLKNTPINHYLAMSLDGIAEFNDMLGGVEVTLKEDFSALDPQMIRGTTLTLRGKQAEYFVRSRYQLGDGSNASRMQRQKEYLYAARDIVMERLQKSPNSIVSMFEVIEQWCVTDLGRGHMLNLANQATQYEIHSIIEIPGENVLGKNGLMEFYADEEALMEIVLTTFYDRVSSV